MDSVLRAATMYLFLLVVFRMVGKRTLAQITPFDMVLLLVIAEATQQALVGQDFSITNAVLVIVTLVGIDVGLSRWRQHSRRVGAILDDVPVILVERGRPIRAHLDRERVDEADIMEAARLRQGLERMEQIKYAVLETDGEISIVPWKPEPGAGAGFPTRGAGGDSPPQV